ncbi:MAG: ABC transporter substrate-binding protein [Desulfovibrio sp. S3730MH75]|nr:MAG: ABC transporter substrate-binding protein [Desulfovibrio sp. S3730MH75]
MFFSFCAASIFIMLSPNQAAAHPHVFVDCTLTFEFDSEGLRGVRQKWWFDEMFATMILGDFDIDRDNKLSSEEAKALENGAFVNLKNFDYFTTILVDGRKHTIATATEFKSTIEDSTLVYKFFIPCRVKQDGKKHTIITAIYDDSLYTAFGLDFTNKINGLPSSTAANLEVDIPEALASLFLQMTPEAAVLTFGPK